MIYNRYKSKIKNSKLKIKKEKRMEIKYLGHSCFRIKNKQGVLVTDPFESDYVGLKFSKTEADICTISHEHKDHNCIKDFTNSPIIIRGPGEYQTHGFTISGYKTFHDEQNGKIRGANTIYIIETEGVRMLHLGDLGHSLDDALLDVIDTIHILFIPIGGVYTIDSKIAAKLTRTIEPSIVIPMHFKTVGVSRDFEQLSDTSLFGKELAKQPETLPKLVFTPSDLTEDLRLVVMSL
jgi:L-ascorbate metabolism protein UlaG (beta-lactamase superfamily)